MSVEEAIPLYATEARAVEMGKGAAISCIVDGTQCWVLKSDLEAKGAPEGIRLLRPNDGLIRDIYLYEIRFGFFAVVDAGWQPPAVDGALPPVCNVTIMMGKYSAQSICSQIAVREITKSVNAHTIISTMPMPMTAGA